MNIVQNVVFHILFATVDAATKAPGWQRPFLAGGQKDRATPSLMPCKLPLISQKLELKGPKLPEGQY